jgi:hypothetical protein
MRNINCNKNQKDTIYLAEAADILDLSVSGKENNSDVLGLPGVSGGDWL